MKKIYNSPKVRTINLHSGNVLAGSNTSLGHSDDPASHETEILSKDCDDAFYWVEE